MANSFDSEYETPDIETLASLADNLVYRLPGCDDIMLRKTIREVYRDFCRRSCCLCGRRHFTISYDDPTVFVSPMFGGLVDSIVEVRYNNRVLGIRDYVESGNRIVFHDRFVPEEDCDESQLPKIDVVFVEIPKLDSESAPSWLVGKYGDAMCCGVLHRLQRMAGKPWSDPGDAQANLVVYENAINEARIGYHAGHSSGDCGSAVDTSDLI